jgi:hypothetical protein
MLGKCPKNTQPPNESVQVCAETHGNFVRSQHKKQRALRTEPLRHLNKIARLSLLARDFQSNQTNSPRARAQFPQPGQTLAPTPAPAMDFLRNGARSRSAETRPLPPPQKIMQITLAQYLVQITPPPLDRVSAL